MSLDCSYYIRTSTSPCGTSAAKKIRPLWRHYYQNTNGLYLGSRLTDYDRLDDPRDYEHSAKEELQSLLRQDELCCGSAGVGQQTRHGRRCQCGGGSGAAGSERTSWTSMACGGNEWPDGRRRVFRHGLAVYDFAGSCLT